MMNSCKPLAFCILLAGLFFLSSVNKVFGQFDQGNTNQALIRITQPGQLADTLNLWGDVGRSGRYLVPRGTTILELISYAGGVGGQGGRTQGSPWAKVNMRITVSRYDEESDREKLKHFSLKYSDPVPPEFRNYQLDNEDVIALQVKQKPGLLDVLGVVGTILGTATTSYFFYDRILR